MMKPIILAKPACSRGCDECWLRCAGLVLSMQDMRRQRDKAVAARDLDEVAQLDSCIAASGRAFAKVQAMRAGETAPVEDRNDSATVH